MSVGWESILPRLLKEAALTCGAAESKMINRSKPSGEKGPVDTQLETI